MLLNNIKPGENLKSFIRFYRIIDFDFSKEPQDVANIKAYRPRIEHCLQFTPFDTESVDYADKKGIVYKIALFGQQTVLTKRKIGKRFLNFQVVFQPGVLHSVFKIPMDELTNIYTDAELFFGSRLRDVNEQLAASKTYEEMIEKVEAFLIFLMNKKQPHLHPVNNIVHLLAVPDSTKKIAQLADKANISHRQFNRVFMANTGISPKDFRTLAKLDLAYLVKNRNPQADWLSIALQSGFYDYQHLSKNYIKFLGHLPPEFYQLEQQAPERRFGDYEQ